LALPPPPDINTVCSCPGTPHYLLPTFPGRGGGVYHAAHYDLRTDLFNTATTTFPHTSLPLRLTFVTRRVGHCRPVTFYLCVLDGWVVHTTQFWDYVRLDVLMDCCMDPTYEHCHYLPHTPVPFPDFVYHTTHTACLRGTLFLRLFTHAPRTVLDGLDVQDATHLVLLRSPTRFVLPYHVVTTHLTTTRVTVVVYLTPRCLTYGFWILHLHTYHTFAVSNTPPRRTR